MARKIKKIRSLRQMMIFFIVVCFIIPMTIFCYRSYRIFEKNLERNVSEHSLQLTKQIETNLDLKLAGYKDMMIQMITNKNVISLLHEANESQEHLVENPKLSSQVIQYIAVAPEFKSIAFLAQDKYIKAIHRWDDRSLESDIYQRTLKNHNQFQWFGGRQQSYRDSFVSHRAEVFSIAREVQDTVSWKTLDMVIVIDIQNKVLADICDKISNDKLPLTWCIVGSNGEILLAADTFFAVDQISQLLKSEQLAAEGISYELASYQEGWYEGRRLLVNNVPLEENDWSIITILDYGYIRQDAAESLRPILIMFMVLFIILVTGTIFVVEKVARPINHLVLEMQYPIRGDFTHKVENINQGISEIAMLQQTYYLMLDQIDHLVHEVYEKGEQKRVVQIKALESQINPHFLYNTLDSIKWTALLQKADNAATMASMLSKLLHISLGQGQDLISVSDEVEHVKAYLGIQKMRLDLQIDVVYSIAQETVEYEVPKILLQPFVENSILHGFAESRSGLIEIICKQKNDHLIFQVSDNGIGMELTQMEVIEKTKGQKNERFSGIGLNNVDQRIKLICGEDYGVTIKSRLGFGTLVTIELPICKKS